MLVFHHEVWRDEAQAWLVVRDLDLLGVIKHVRTEGHPLLWYFLVMPLAKVIHGFNAVFSMQILNWLFVVAGVGVFLFKSPFNFFLKISVILSSGFLYWYPVIARSYCLIPFLVFLLAVLYKKQKEHPFVYAGLLIALANTHVIMFGFCGALAIVFACQFKDEIKSLFDKNDLKNVCNKITLVAPALVFLALFSIVAYLWGSQQENYNVYISSHIENISNMIDILEKIVFNILGFENLFYNFESAEAVSKYYSYGKTKIDVIVEGNKCDLCVYCKFNISILCILLCLVCLITTKSLYIIYCITILYLDNMGKS